MVDLTTGKDTTTTFKWCTDTIQPDFLAVFHPGEGGVQALWLMTAENILKDNGRLAMEIKVQHNFSDFNIKTISQDYGENRYHG